MFFDYTGGLLKWMNSFSGMHQWEFDQYGLGAMFQLKRVQIDTQILHAAAQLWDPEVHVFRFGCEELCPTIEEFQFLLGSSSKEEVVIPVGSHNPIKTLMKLCKLGTNESKALLKDGELHVRQLIDKFCEPPKGYFTSEYTKVAYPALCMCLLARYLLISVDGKTNPAVVDITLQIKDGKDAIPMILAETLMGLDAVSNGETYSFAGSPLLLQMWLMDKVKLLTKPAASPYKTTDYPGRKSIERFRKEEDWLQWFKSLDADSIAWRCPDWTLPRSMTVSNMDLGWVFIVGFTKSTFYIPQRFNRQYANDQTPLLADMIPPRTDVINRLDLEAYTATWYRRTKMVASSRFAKHTSRSYKTWLAKDIEKRAKKRNTLKRKRT